MVLTKIGLLNRMHLLLHSIDTEKKKRNVFADTSALTAFALCLPLRLVVAVDLLVFGMHTVFAYKWSTHAHMHRHTSYITISYK